MPTLTKEKLLNQLRDKNAAPFLFIGSGFSRRYLRLEDWNGLLRKFAEGLKPYEYYFSTAGGDLPQVATLISNDFHDFWWKDDKYKISRETHKFKIKDKTSALKIEICDYLSLLSANAFNNPQYEAEIAILNKLNVDGIITTNWDIFLEQLFPDYRVFIGQNELLFSNPQSIGEIYKIHGSLTKPNSIVLCKSDYDEYNKKNAYLAAKLITIFVEHPIVFIGYSLSDENIAALLTSIVQCLGADKIDQLRSNLIFVQWEKDLVEYSMSNTIMSINGIQLPITVIKADSFIPVYEAIHETKRKIPARILRYCKEQLFELVRSHQPEEKLFVLDIDNIDKKEDVEFVVGVGVIEHISDKGYKGYESMDLFRDLLFDNGNFDFNMIVNHTIPSISKRAKYIPVFKYLNGIGIKTLEDYTTSGLELDKHINVNHDYFQTRSYLRSFVNNAREKTCAEIIDFFPAEKAAIYLSFIKAGEIDITLIEKFLQENIELFDNQVSNYSTHFKKLACYLDYLKYGWSK